MKIKSEDIYDIIIKNLIEKVNIDALNPTYITDEEFALRNSLHKQFEGRVMLCAWHKGNNFASHITNENGNEEYKNVAYSLDKVKVHEGVVALMALSGGPKDGFFANWILSVVSEFSAYINREKKLL